MTKAEFIVERTRIISEMLDNPNKSGIYPTTRCFNELDALFDRLVQFEDIEVGRKYECVNDGLSARGFC